MPPEGRSDPAIGGSASAGEVFAGMLRRGAVLESGLFGAPFSFRGGLVRDGHTKVVAFLNIASPIC
jgi:hypothetical protein